jgi:hypothetical protein
MEVSLHRCYLSRTLLYVVVFSSLLAWILCLSRSQHDGRTVTLMLAKLGEGPLLRERNRSSVATDGAGIDCEQQEESCSGRTAVNLTIEARDGSVGAEIESLCWGYEKDCDKSNRLFVPHCNEPHKPWYVCTPAVMPISNLNRRLTVKLHITCILSKYIPFHDCIMQSTAICSNSF